MDGEGIKLTRKRLQKTQGAMAAELGVSRQSYIAWEKDTYKIPQDKLEKLLAMDASVPAGGLTPKETAKEKRDREAFDESERKRGLEIYQRMRLWPQGSNHNKAMAYLAREGTVIPPQAYQSIVEAFPDVLTDPNGDYMVSKERSHAILLSTSNPET
jgi:DNA-binding XRE family transcriptional regulator